MSKDDVVAVVIAIVAWAASAWRSKRKAAAVYTEQAKGVDVPRGWLWPLAPLADGSEPLITSGWGSPRPKPGGGMQSHRGVDIVYRRHRPIPKGEKVPPHEYRGYHVPEGTPVRAVAGGTIWAATGKEHRASGGFVIIDHDEPGWTSYYQHLDELHVPPHAKGKQLGANGAKLAPMRVEEGDVIGTVGWSKLDGEQGRHLHFEVRKGKTAVNPQAVIEATWRHD